MSKPKKCKVCGDEFEPFTSFQKACGTQCALVIVRQDNAKKLAKDAEIKEKLDRADIRKRKRALKSKSDWLREAQAEFNKYVRLRDEKFPCISCGRHHKGQYHAGHYLSVGACAELRFHPYNNNKQCSACNNYLSGNQVKYRKRLIKKIGVQNVEWLEGPQQIQHLTIEDIQEIKQHYKEQTKILTTKLGLN